MKTAPWSDDKIREISIAATKAAKENSHGVNEAIQYAKGLPATNIFALRAHLSRMLLARQEHHRQELSPFQSFNVGHDLDDDQILDLKIWLQEKFQKEGQILEIEITHVKTTFNLGHVAASTYEVEVVVILDNSRSENMQEYK